MRNRVTEMLGIDVPIFGFTHKPEVAIEVTNAGGMGALAASYYQPDELERILTDMDDKTGGKPDQRGCNGKPLCPPSQPPVAGADVDIDRHRRDDV